MLGAAEDCFAGLSYLCSELHANTFKLRYYTCYSFVFCSNFFTRTNEWCVDAAHNLMPHQEALLFMLCSDKDEIRLDLVSEYIL